MNRAAIPLLILCAAAIVVLMATAPQCTSDQSGVRVGHILMRGCP